VFNFQKGSLTQGETTQTFASSGGAAVPAVQSTEVTAVTAASPVHYFLKVDGAIGDSQDASHLGWFNVDGFDFSMTTPTNLSGIGIGRSQIAPLAVDINSVIGLATLLGDEVHNQHIKSVELVGVENGGDAQQTVYDLKLTNVTLDSLHNEPSAHGGVEADLTFGFQKGSLTQGETTRTFGSSNGGTAALPQDTGMTQVSATSAVHYFLKVDGAIGDSTDASHSGWFTVDGFDFGLTTPTSAGTRGVSGRSHIAPLSVDLHSTTGLAALFNDEVTNHHVKSVELVGVQSVGDGGQQTVYDLKLSNAALDSFHNAPGAQGVEADLAFNFQKGTLTQGETTTAFGASGGAGVASAATSSEATQVPASSPVHYFLKIPGVTGDSTDTAHSGWFNVDGFDFGVSTPTSVGTGLPTGRAHFSPLSVDLNSLTGITALLTDEVNHRLIRSAELVGVEGAPGQQQTVYDLKLSNVQVTAVHTDPTGQSGVDTDVVLNFAKATLTDPASTPPTTTTTAAVHQDVLLSHDHGFLL
jgi:type VI secretion system secreted protein Hcp